MKFKPKVEKAFYEKIQRDATFKQNLLNNPNQTIKAFLKEFGDKEHSSSDYKIYLEKKNEALIVIPQDIMESTDLSEKELAKISAGKFCACQSVCASCI